MTTAAGQHAPTNLHANASAIPGAHHVIAVASGNGGAGKSATAMKLDVALSVQGLEVGLLGGGV